MLPAEPFRPKRADWRRPGPSALGVFLRASMPPLRLAPWRSRTMGFSILSSYFLGIRTSSRLSAFHADRPSLYVLAVWLRRSTAVHLAMRVVRRPDRRRSLALRARPDRLGRLPAYLAALALGVFTRVPGSQAIIRPRKAVIPSITFFFLVWSSWRCRPAALHAGAMSSGASRWLALMALVFGLSLSNHYHADAARRAGLRHPALAACAGSCSAASVCCPGS